MITAHIVLNNTENGRSAIVRTTQVYYVAECYEKHGASKSVDFRTEYFRSTVFGKAVGKAYRWVKDE